MQMLKYFAVVGATAIVTFYACGIALGIAMTNAM